MAETKRSRLHPLLALGIQLGEWLLAILVYCIAVDLCIYFFEIKRVKWGAEVGLINTIILGLLLSFRNRTAFDRWWSARILWGKLVNDSRNLAIKVTAYVPRTHRDDVPFADWLAGFAVALKRHLRGTPQSLSEIRGFESATAETTHAPLLIAARIQGQVADWYRAGALEKVGVEVMDPHLQGLMDVSGGCERILNTPLSPSYTALLRVGIALNVLIAPWVTLSESGLWGLPLFMISCFFLLGVELVDSNIEDPFGTDADDLDMEKYCQTIERDVRTVLGQ